MKRFIQYIIVTLTALAATGCQDDFMKQEIIGEGKAGISATLDFKPMSSALSQTRAAGDALKDIKSLHILLYNEDGELLKSWTQNETKQELKNYEVTSKDRTDADAENGHKAESTTAHATFTLPGEIDFGKYYMYAVANIPDLLTAYAENITTVKGLKSIPLTWDNTKNEETGEYNVANNGQMLGCFTNSTPSNNSIDEPLIINNVSSI